MGDFPRNASRLSRNKMAEDVGKDACIRFMAESEFKDLNEQMWELTVSYNQLVGLPTSIQKLNRLQWLRVNANKLTELPSEIGDLKELRGLNVSDNQLVCLPTSIQKLNTLNILYLHKNNLTELPVVKSLSAKYRPDRYRRDKSVKFGTELP